MSWTNIEKELPATNQPVVLCRTDRDGITEMYLCCVDHVMEPECGEHPAEDYHSLYDITKDDIIDYIIFDPKSDDGHYFETGVKGKWMYADEFQKLTKLEIGK